MFIFFTYYSLPVTITKKGKGSSYSITARRIPELIPVLGTQSAGDVSHKPITFRQACSYPRNP